MTLSNVLSKLISFSARNGQANSATLERGLTVQVHLHPDKFTLRIARHGTDTPSRQEYQTCLRALPEQYKPVTPIEPVPYMEHGYNLLSASWPLPERLL